MIVKLLLDLFSMIAPILFKKAAELIEKWLEKEDHQCKCDKRDKRLEKVKAATDKAQNKIIEINKKIADSKEKETHPGMQKVSASHKHHISR